MIKIISTILGASLMVILVGWFGTRSIGSDVLRAGWAIPANIVVHMLQLFCSACAWRVVIDDQRLSRLTFLKIRTIREGVNSLLPVAQIGGPIVGVRLLSKAGIDTAVAAGGTTLDITLEAIAQLVFTMAGIAMLAAIGQNPGWANWASGGLALGAVGLVAFVIAQRAGLLRLIEALSRLAQRYRPSLSLEALRGLHDELMRLQKNHLALVKTLILHLVSWSGGSFEVYLGLMAIGSPVSLPQAFIIESLAMAARSAAFAVPGALGVQEGGFVFVSALFGVPPDAAIAMSMLKRLREVLVATPALILWQWTEIRRYLAN